MFFGECGSGYLNIGVLITTPRVREEQKIRKRGKSKDVYHLSIIGQLNEVTLEILNATEQVAEQLRGELRQGALFGLRDRLAIFSESLTHQWVFAGIDLLDEAL